MKPIAALVLVVGITILCGVFAYRQLSALRAPLPVAKRSSQRVRRAQGSQALSKEGELSIERKASANVPSLIPSAVPASLLPDTAKVLPIKMEVISWSPRILLIDNMLSYEAGSGRASPHVAPVPPAPDAETPRHHSRSFHACLVSLTRAPQLLLLAYTQ
ncbi:hypothetical protein CYMTET_7404 [Cymbomonas tetramitiformis]|uniref:Uncharacterized protein n=1 Tax=Cymbomonas tetramitiformis TaxID=36881 RepID=A0AAE0LH38_9CHLO|nr:hypothetical protein CYMTET_7404 [Cymbomonas tetramitiformis]